MRRFMLAILALGVAAGPGSADARRLQAQQIQHFPFPFVDEAKQEPEFQAFRDRLERRLKDGDLQGLAAAMAPSLRAHWEGWLPTIAYNVGRILPLGGAFTTTRGAVPGRREFCAPYVYGAFPNEVPHAIQSTADPWAIIGARVAVRVEPRPSASVLTYLSWELVKADGWFEPDSRTHLQWARVDLLDGRRGYVQEGQIRPTTDYYACFARVDGQWLMTAWGRDRYPARGN
jgi:hypothetical protein